MNLISPAEMTVAAAVIPPVVAMINQRHWSSPVKGLVALAVCLAFAALVIVFRGQPFDWAHWRDEALQVCALAFAAYKLWWNPSGIAPAIEALTTPGAAASVGAHRSNG